MNYNAADYKQMLVALLPQGAAWQGDNIELLLEAWAQEFVRLQTRMNDLVRESDARTTNELLTDFERELSLPSACFASENPTFLERQTAVVELLRGKGALTIEQLKNIALNLGVELEITEGWPSKFGQSFFGDRLAPEESKFYLFVKQTNATIVDATFNLSRFGDKWRSFGNQLIACLFKDLVRADRVISYQFGV